MNYRRDQMECPACQNGVETSWKMCPACGQVLSADRECELCGAGLLSGWKACPTCGGGAMGEGIRERGGARSAMVACEECGKRLNPGDVFACRICGREKLCRQHHNEAFGGCDTCAAKARQEKLGKLRKGRFEFGEQWENSLGMKFVRVPRTETLFSIWATRVRDYELFANDVGLELTTPAFGQGPSHPAVYVSWQEAQSFCHWLTEREWENGALEPRMEYRLPCDLEWNCAVGLPPERGNTPKSRDEKIQDHYPWGSEWPPPKRAGNYDQELKVDFHVYTSPVGNFKANKFGIYDLGGNVWEWCLDWYDDEESARVLRGASWSNYGQGILLSSCRRNCAPDFRNDYIGFRCVLADVS